MLFFESRRASKPHHIIDPLGDRAIHIRHFRNIPLADMELVLVSCQCLYFTPVCLRSGYKAFKICKYDIFCIFFGAIALHVQKQKAEILFWFLLTSFRFCLPSVLDHQHMCYFASRPVDVIKVSNKIKFILCGFSLRRKIQVWHLWIGSSCWYRHWLAW